MRIKLAASEVGIGNRLSGEPRTTQQQIMRLFLAAVAILSIAQAVPIKNSKKNVDETAGSDLDPNNFLFVASHGKRY